MEITYLSLSVTGFIAAIILENMDNQLKFVALGFGVTMLLFGIFCKDKVDTKEVIVDKGINNLNKIGVSY